MNRITINDVVYIKGTQLDANGVVTGGTLKIDQFFNNFTMDGWGFEDGVVNTYAVYEMNTVPNGRHFALVYNAKTKYLRWVNEVYGINGSSPYFNYQVPSTGDYTKISYKNDKGSSSLGSLGNPQDILADGTEIPNVGGNHDILGIGVTKLVTPFPVFASDDFQGVYNYFTNGDDSSKIIQEPPAVHWDFYVDEDTKACKLTVNLDTKNPVTSYTNMIGIEDLDGLKVVFNETTYSGDVETFINIKGAGLASGAFHHIHIKTDAIINGFDFNFDYWLRLDIQYQYQGLLSEPSYDANPNFISSDDIYPSTVTYTIGNFDVFDENKNPDDGKDIDEEDTVDFPKDDVDDLPIASHTILTQTYVLTKPQIDSLGVALWDTNFFEALVKNANYPLDNIISCKLFPLNLGHGNASQLMIGNVDMGFQCYKLDNKQVYKSTVLHYNPIFTKRKFLNYEPFSNYMIYLPFVGTVNINSQFLVDRDVQIAWIVDFTTGDLTTVVMTDGRTRYSFNSQVAVDIPLSASNRSQVEASTLKQAVGNLIGGNVGGAVSTAVSGLLSGETSTSTPPSSSNALCMSMTPYIIAERVQYVDSDGYDKTYGVPLREYWQLGYLQGFTQCQNVHLEKCSATSEEKALIETLLEQGVYL